MGHKSLNEFIEAVLRPWVDSEKFIFNEKNCLGINLLKVTKNIFCKIHHGLAMAFGLSKMNSKLHCIYIAL